MAESKNMRAKTALRRVPVHCSGGSMVWWLACWLQRS